LTGAIAALAFACLAGCRTAPPPAPAIGEAFVGPLTLKLRSDIPLQASTVVTLKHGERVEIVQRRRRFLKVRAPSGSEGWTDERQLLAAEDMTSLRDLTNQARSMVAQGQATAFGELNVHTQPWRQSPSFSQLKEGEKADVLMHRATPRTEMPRKPLLPPPPKKPKAAAKKTKEEPKYPPPPMPKPPGAPANWLELSRIGKEPATAAAPVPKEEEAAIPIPTDDWSLIRLPNGTAGWVLTRRLMMAIPDDVAQYAEGHRIVSYFPLGDINEGGQKKHHWLWTTMTASNASYDFDSFRVFIWSEHRHRYETAHIERNIKGYAPVVVGPVAMPNAGKGTTDASATSPGFSICMERKDGQRYRREYAFLTNIVRFSGERPCESAPAATLKAPGAAPLVVVQSPQQQKPSLWQRFKTRVRSLTSRAPAK
jgi:hypothetical protein